MKQINGNYFSTVIEENEKGRKSEVQVTQQLVEGLIQNNIKDQSNGQNVQVERKTNFMDLRRNSQNGMLSMVQNIQKAEKVKMKNHGIQRILIRNLNATSSSISNSLIQQNKTSNKSNLNHNEAFSSSPNPFEPACSILKQSIYEQKEYWIKSSIVDPNSQDNSIINNQETISRPSHSLFQINNYSFTADIQNAQDMGSRDQSLSKLNSDVTMMEKHQLSNIDQSQKMNSDNNNQIDGPHLNDQKRMLTNVIARGINKNKFKSDLNLNDKNSSFNHFAILPELRTPTQQNLSIIKPKFMWKNLKETSTFSFSTFNTASPAQNNMSPDHNVTSHSEYYLTNNKTQNFEIKKDQIVVQKHFKSNFSSNQDYNQIGNPVQTNSRLRFRKYSKDSQMSKTSSTHKDKESCSQMTNKDIFCADSQNSVDLSFGYSHLNDKSQNSLNFKQYKKKPDVILQKERTQKNVLHSKIAMNPLPSLKLNDKVSKSITQIQKPKKGSREINKNLLSSEQMLKSIINSSSTMQKQENSYNYIDETLLYLSPSSLPKLKNNKSENVSTNDQEINRDQNQDPETKPIMQTTFYKYQGESVKLDDDSRKQSDTSGNFLNQINVSPISLSSSLHKQRKLRVVRLKSRSHTDLTLPLPEQTNQNNLNKSSIIPLKNQATIKTQNQNLVKKQTIFNQSEKYINQSTEHDQDNERIIQFELASQKESTPIGSPVGSPFTPNLIIRNDDDTIKYGEVEWQQDYQKQTEQIGEFIKESIDDNQSQLQEAFKLQKEVEQNHQQNISKVIEQVEQDKESHNINKESFRVNGQDSLKDQLNCISMRIIEQLSYYKQQNTNLLDQLSKITFENESLKQQLRKYQQIKQLQQI